MAIQKLLGAATARLKKSFPSGLKHWWKLQNDYIDGSGNRTDYEYCPMTAYREGIALPVCFMPPERPVLQCSHFSSKYDLVV